MIMKEKYIWIITGCVILFNTVLFLLPSEVRQDLALSINNITPINILLSNYTHSTPLHFLGNMFIYIVLVSILIKIEKNKKRLFYASLFFLTIGPVIIAVADLTFLPKISSLGFSGIVMMFVGYLPVAVYSGLKEKYGLKSTFPWIFFMWNIFPLCLFLGKLVITIAVFAIFLGYLLHNLAEIKKLLPDLLKRRKKKLKFLDIFLFGFAVAFLIAPYETFLPAIIEGMRSNIFAHYVGYVVGFLVGLVLPKDD